MSPALATICVGAARESIPDLMQLGAHVAASTAPAELEASDPGVSADMREPQEVECLRFCKPPPGAIVRRVAAELDQAGLCRVQGQRECCQSLGDVVSEPLRISLVLETDDDVIG